MPPDFNSTQQHGLSRRTVESELGEPPGNAARPGGNQGASDGGVAVNHEDTDPVRCLCCNRPLRVPRSVSAGIGPRCAARVLDGVAA